MSTNSVEKLMNNLLTVVMKDQDRLMYYRHLIKLEYIDVIDHKLLYFHCTVNHLKMVEENLKKSFLFKTILHGT